MVLSTDAPLPSYRMHTSDSIHSISATKKVSTQSHLLRLRQYLMAQSAYPANPLKKSRFSKYVNRIAVTKQGHDMRTAGLPYAPDPGSNAGAHSQRLRNQADMIGAGD